MRSTHRDPANRVRPLIIAVVLAVSQVGTAAAQRIEFDGVASRGDRPETRRLFGYTARVSMPLLPLVGVAVGYSRMAGSGEIDNPECAGAGCIDPRLSNDLVFTTVDYELMLPLRLFGLEFSAAAGVDVTTVRIDELRAVETGQVVRAHAPEHGFLESLTSLNGRHYRFGAGISPLLGLPVTLHAAWQRRITDLDACAADTYAPFCGEMKADQLLLGVSIGTR